jgi:IS4 transposase
MLFTGNMERSDGYVSIMIHSFLLDAIMMAEINGELQMEWSDAYDREADSVGHFRQWREDNAGWLVRVKEGSRIKYNDTDMYVVEVANQLTYREVGKVSYKGKPARQKVAKATVILSRKTSSTKGAKDVEDKPLEVKLIVSRIFNMQGERVAQWCLLADVDPSIDEAVLATWYYYRWRIESYFKLLKQAGHQF